MTKKTPDHRYTCNRWRAERVWCGVTRVSMRNAADSSPSKLKLVTRIYATKTHSRTDE